MKEYIKGCFKQNKSSYNIPNIPSYSELENIAGKKFVFNNIYSAHFILEDQNPVSSFAIIARSSSYIIQKKEIKLIVGLDKECRLFDNFEGKLHTIEIENTEVMTEAKYDSLKVEFTKGITSVEIKNGEVKFVDDIPDAVFQPYLIEKFKMEPNGEQTIKYQISNVLGEKEVIINPEEKVESSSENTNSSFIEDYWPYAVLAILFLLKLIK